MNPERSYLGAFIVTGAAAAGIAVWAFQLVKQRNALDHDLRQAENTIARNAADHEQQVAQIVNRHDQEMATLEATWQAKVDELRARQTRRLNDAYEQFSALVGEGEGALKYLAQLESRLRQGQEVSDEELESLAAIGAGLSILQTRYRKPMSEFRELGEYLESRAASDVQAPDTRFSALKRIFSRSFREQEREYQLDLAKQQAFQEAFDQFNKAYASAQSQMDGLGADLAQLTDQLYALIDTKGASYQDLERFFETSRKTIDIHREMLEFEPEVVPPAGTEP